MKQVFDQYIDLRYWNLARILRVGFGIVLLVAAFFSQDGITAVFGGLLLLQGMLNIGCIGGACAVPRPESKPTKESIKPE
ncbi:MAG TPA: hypothetical protein ENJ82_05805 [Bacteroidetes bacterium]|nr:hypothetical protein [Bacteroidota bacterium]